jgi:hypothetical protein
MKKSVIWLAGLVCMSGCGQGGSLPPTVDPKQAREALTAALDAWKNDQALASLAERTPPIHFSEAKWEKGFRLVQYKILPRDDWDGRMVKLTAELTLRDKHGTELQPREIAYTIDTHTRIAIVRSDWSMD